MGSFFVLSGFLLSGLLFREHQKFGQISTTHFLIRRGFKIYPPFWILILATVAVKFIRHRQYRPMATICELLFVQNYTTAWWWHTWSLAVEEHFYLFLAFFFWILSRRCKAAHPFRVVPWAFAILAVLCLGLRIHAVLTSYQHLGATHLRMDSLFAGVFISYLYHYHPEGMMNWGKRYRPVLPFAGILLMSPVFFHFMEEKTWFTLTVGLTLSYIGAGLLLIAAFANKTPCKKMAGAVAYLGSYSYSIYLWHLPVETWFVPILNRKLPPMDNWYVNTGFHLVGSLVFGVLMALAVELPVLRIRDCWFPSKGRPLTISPPFR